MSSDFAIFVMPLRHTLGPHNHAVTLVGPCPGGLFIERGPWMLNDVRTKRQYTVTYLLPSTIEMGDSYETPSETVKRCLQSIPRFPFHVEPALDPNGLPTILTFPSRTQDPMTKIPIRCLCSFDHELGIRSPDVRALICDTAELQQHSVRALQGIPRPRNRKIEGIVEQYEAAAVGTLLTVGTVLPCEVEVEGSSCFGACLLVEQREADVFLCDFHLEKPTDICEGSKLYRKVSCQETKATKAVEYSAEIATVLEIRPQADFLASPSA